MIVATGGEIWWDDPGRVWRWRIVSTKAGAEVEVEGSVKLRVNTGLARLRREVQAASPIVLPLSGWRRIDNVIGWRLEDQLSEKLNSLGQRRER